MAIDRDSPGDSRTRVNSSGFPACLGYIREVRTPAGALGSPNGGRRGGGRVDYDVAHECAVEESFVAETESSIFKFHQTRESSDTLILIAFCSVAPSDLFKLRAIFAVGAFFRARDLSSRMCAVVHARLFYQFFMSVSIYKS